MSVQDVYLKIETIPGYSPVEPDDHVSPPAAVTSVGIASIAVNLP